MPSTFRKISKVNYPSLYVPNDLKLHDWLSHPKPLNEMSSKFQDILNALNFYLEGSIRGTSTVPQDQAQDFVPLTPFE